MNLSPIQGTKPTLGLLFGGRKQAPKPNQRVWQPTAADTFQYQNGKKTHIESLLGGGQIFDKVDEMLNKASKSVLIDLYNFQSPDLYPEKSSPLNTPGADVQAALVNKLVTLKKTNPKMDIKVVIDNHFDKEFNEGHNNRTIAYLRKNGIDVVTYPNFSTISHVKVLLVDNKFAMIGGMNWGNHSATNHDAAVFIEGPDVNNIFQTVFKPDWVAAGRKADELPKMPTFKEGQIKVMQTSAKESPQGAKDEIFQELLNQIDNAQESIHAQLFSFTQLQIADRLIAAHKRMKKAGKEGVKILVDPGLFFAFPGARNAIQKLARAGIPIRFFETNRDVEEKLHAKWAVFDRKRLVIGSANWSNVGLLSNVDLTDEQKAEAKDSGYPQRISRSNHEIALLINSAKVASNFAKQADYDFKEASFPILEFRDGRWTPLRPGSTPPPPSPFQQKPQGPKKAS